MAWGPERDGVGQLCAQMGNSVGENIGCRGTRMNIQHGTVEDHVGTV